MRFDCIRCRKATTKPQGLKGAFIRMLTDENRQLSVRLNSLAVQYNGLADGFKAEIKWKDTVLDFLAALLAKMSSLFRQAVNAIVNFAQSGYGGKLGGSGHKDIFDDEEAAVIKSTMIDIAGKDGNHKAVGNWLVQVAQSAADLTDVEIHRAQCEVDDVASGKYDWRTKNSLKPIKQIL